MLPIITAGLMVIVLPIYIYTEYKLVPKRYFIAKTICSLLFLLTAIIAMLQFGINPKYALPIILALSLGLIGDVLLAFSHRGNCFLIGLVSFLLGQLVYTYVFFSFGGFMPLDIVVYLLTLGLCLVLYSKAKLELGKMKIPVLVYMVIIILMFTSAISLAYKNGFSNIITIMICIGATLFLASDIVLAYVKFKPGVNKALRGINLSLYYMAQIILALTLQVMGYVGL